MRRVVLIVLCALTSFSCTHDPFDDARNPKSLTNVSLDLDIPVSELVVTYSAADDAARENSVVRFDVFAFDESGAIIPDAEGHIVFTSINMVNGKGKLTVPVTIPAGATEVKRQFGIVANAVDKDAMAAVKTLADFRALEFSLGTTMQTTNFVMSDISALNTINSTNPIINMSLRRAVSRVDVVLQDEVTNFEITSVRLVNVRDKGYLFGKNSDETDLSSPIAIPASSSLVNYDPVDAKADELKRNFTSQLYCLENYNADKDAAAKTTAVIVGGIFNGQTCYYRVNLHDNNRDAQLRRNYIYRVNIRRVNGAGNPDADAAINDSPQNIDYTISEWDYSLHSDVIFDGKNYLGVSKSKFSMPKGAGSGSIDVVSNYAESEWSFSSCDELGKPVATPSWISYTKEGTKVTFAVTENTAADAAPRIAYLKVAATSNAKLSLIISVQQYHTDQTLIGFEPQILTASWDASVGLFKSKVTILVAGTTWTVEKLTLMEDKARNWCRLKGGALVGGTGTTTVANETFDLVFDVDQMSASLLSRTAQVTVKVKDPSGFEESRVMTLTQSAISSSLTVGRLYVAKTAESDVEKIAVNTSSAWSAKFYTGNGVNVTAGCTWLSFTDQNYAPLATPAAASGTGSGAIYVKFDACPANNVRDGYVVVNNGSQQQWIRIHQGDYRTVVIDGYEMLDRNMGATSAPTDHNMLGADQVTTNGYLYQWGRCPDGSETFLGAIAAQVYLATSSATLVTRQPIYGDPAWGKLIHRGTPPTITSTTGIQTSPATAHHWLSPDASITPAPQRDLRKLWDARGVASDQLSGTNLTSMRTEFDPCPDGWRVPTARELENILKYGSKQLRPINRSEEVSHHGRFIANDNHGYVYFPTSNVRRRPHATGFTSDDTYSTNTSAGWYWTSSYSVEAGPYALRLYRSDVPDLLYTHRTGRKAPVVYPAVTTAVDNMAGGNLMSVRCIRDRKITEELIVSVRRKTISNLQQGLSVNLTANNLLGTWRASSDAGWLSVSPAVGSGDGALDLRATANNSGEVRQGAIRIISDAGTVATIVVVQLDESCVLVEAAGGIKRWWRSRNVGATRSDFVALNDDNVGYFYGWGANIPIRYTGGTNATSNAGAQSWNLATTQATAYGNYPYPIKHPNNDPCPDGWRVPSYDELASTYINGPAASQLTDVSANGWLHNRKTGSGIWLPAMGYYNTTNQVIAQGRNGYYWSSLYATGTNYAYYLLWQELLEQETMTTLDYTYGASVRCVQETSDSFD